MSGFSGLAVNVEQLHLGSVQSFHNCGGKTLQHFVTEIMVQFTFGAQALRARQPVKKRGDL
jgi:hypothetical protein